ncbi:hypothetical protein SAMD00019534_046220 [Acytostelium subglobosum LB1]|uniref:hypothetical protein n=1 Tax=Acytostelium subglobosum LB1 TaxID=1410327 RepID=UPI0006448BDD|nr:hypothetical protein SAMD00019534_046220 [Acytostelium subglobosum LB1]GAM21447.1 hypothetical protein SAMD00019534_046220 [Acytostelium subglobosum LB1]|eukprot:XP_012755566.1 hypothetical protein SAMD00019534_046220 [Acytostelium subglobosum LB1]
MKYIVAFALLCVALVAAKSISTEQSQFRAFQTKYNKQYTNEEFTYRFGVFKNNLKVIRNMNLKSKAQKSTATFDVNAFADLTVDEFKKYYLNSVVAERDMNAPVAADVHVDAMPTNYDWATLGAVTPVKNQGQCGSCWSFSATGNIEGAWFLAGNNLTGLSEQNLVDCDHECMQYLGDHVCDQGCNGGLQPNAYEYILKNGGIDTEESYPYTGVTGTTCNFDASNIGAKISSWTYVSSNETTMASYLYANGPLAIAADALTWQYYSGGVFDFKECGSVLDHGILITGFGVDTTNNEPYWIVKNSWGADWGESGYMRIIRGKGLCGLNTFVTATQI